MTSPKVLVTGATGFLGRHLLLALKQQNIPTVALMRDVKAWEGMDWCRELPDVEIVRGSLLHPAEWQKSPKLRGVSAILHTAAEVKHSRKNVDEMLQLNVGGTLEMVRAAGQLGARLIFVSSSGTVGCFRHSDVAADEDAPYAELLVGRWPYYASKIRAEQEGRRLAEKCGVNFVVVRPPVLLGPGDHRHRSTGHVRKMLEGKVPFVPRGGMHFTDVRDAASALVKLCVRDEVRATYHLPGTACSLMDFFQMVGEVAGVSPPKKSPPNWLVRGIAATGRLLGGSLGGLPDPVVLEMATCHWGLSTLWSHKELDYRPRTARQTLVDTVHFIRAERPELMSGAPRRAVA